MRASLLNKETGEVKEQEIFMGDFPLMTDSRHLCHQRCRACHRLPAGAFARRVSIGMHHDKTGKELFTATVIPNRGAWLEYETDSNDVFYVRIDKNRKLPITVLCAVRWACRYRRGDPGLSSATTSASCATIEKDTTKNAGGRPAGSLPQAAPRRAAHGGERYKPHLNSLFFDPQPLRSVPGGPL